MVIIDTLLAARENEGNPIRVAIVGTGFMGTALVYQITKYKPGMRVVASSNRHIEKAKQAYIKAGIADIKEPHTIEELENNITNNEYSVCEDPLLICKAKSIDAVVEVTGSIEYAAEVAWHAIRNKKHFISMNAELDSTVGPILKTYADKAGVVYTNVDGDQPGVIMNVYRMVKGMGLKPVMCGNMKGLQDPYRNPTTQISFAKQWNQKPDKVASFADGSKISFEQSIIANNTKMRVAKRGMHGPTAAPNETIKDVIKYFPLEDIINGPGIVDYIVGISEPAPGIFVLATTEDAFEEQFLKLYKLGDGPLYLFYEPYHLCHFLAPNSIARAVLLGDTAVTPAGRPYVEVVARAKRDLKAYETIDGIGFYMTYGECENADIRKKENLLPMGLAEGCILKRDIPKDQTLTFDDVMVPEGRLADKLYKEQEEYPWDE